MECLAKRRQKTRRVCALLVFFVLSAGSCSRHGDRYTYQAAAANAGPKLSDSIEFMEDRVKKRPNSYLDKAELAGLYLQRGRARRNQDDVKKARELVGKSLADFESPSGLMVKADLLQMEHHFPEALEAVDKVLKLDPTNSGARILGVRICLAQGEVKAARERLETLPQDPLSSLYFLRGQVAEAEGDIEGARSLYHQALGTEATSGSASESARLRGVLARLELEEGNREEAGALLEAAHAIPVEQPLTETLRAGLLVSEHKPEEAAALLRAAYEHYRDPVFLIRLGEVEQSTGETDKAKSTFQSAVALLENGAFGHERDLALALYYLDPKGNAEEIKTLMERELARRHDSETLRVKSLVEGSGGGGGPAE